MDVNWTRLLKQTWSGLALSDSMVPLGKFLSVARGQSYHVSDVGDDGVPMYGMASFAPEGGFRDHKPRRYRGSVSTRGHIESGDILVATTDMGANILILGRVAEVPPFRDPGMVTADLGKVCWKTDDNKFRRYLYWTMRTKAFREYCLSVSRGTAVKRVHPDDIAAYPIRLPLDRDYLVVHILDAVESRLRTFPTINQTLENIARIFFKSWFIDFDPVHAKVKGRSTGLPPEIDALFPEKFEESAEGMVPEGWLTGNVTDLAEFVNGRNFTKAASGTGRLVIRIADLRAGRETGSTVFNEVDAAEVNIAEQGDILFPWSGSLGLYRWPGEQALINQHIFKVIPKRVPAWHLFYALANVLPIYQGIASNKTTTMGHINRGHLKEGNVVIPPDWVLERASSIFHPLYDKWLANVRQSQTLTDLRDTMLPHLVSGDLKLPVEVPD